MAVGGCLAAPAINPSTDLVLYHQVDDASSELAVLDKRFDCRSIGRVIKRIGTSQHVSAIAASGHATVYAICRLAGYTMCGDVMEIVTGAIFFIYYTTRAATEGAVPGNLPTHNKRDADIEASILQGLVQSLADANFPYDEISSLPFNTTEESLMRRDGDPRLVSRIRVAGVAFDGQNKQDMVVNHFEDGNAVLHLPINPAPGGQVQKRGGHYGFKISYTTRQRSLLTDAHKKEMARTDAAYWAHTADTDRHMGSYMGLANMDHKANFYYRIIPETVDFGLNYESVDICGGLAKYL